MIVVIATVGQRYDGFHGIALAALVAAACAAVVWVAFLLVRWFVSVPRLPRAGPETTELGPEPPAVVNMLVNGWYVTAAAVPATLVDLAARKVVGLEEVGPGRFVVRTRPVSGHADLAPYELHVVRLVETRATGGSAPVEVLQLGTHESELWLGQFSAAVVKDSETRGLATRGWGRGAAIALTAGLALVLGLAALALELAHVGTSNGAHRTRGHSGAWFGLAAVAWTVAMMSSTRLRTIRATRAGREACARWLGVRGYLRHDTSFAEQPPPGVAIWGRLLAYGIALGANRASTAALPVGPDDPDHVWSRESGTWRQLRVRYPRRFGAGEAPKHVFVKGLAQLVLWVAVAVIALPLLVTVLWHVVHDVVTKSGDLAVLGVVALFVAIPTVGAVYVGARIVDGAVRVWRGTKDLRNTAVVEGRVVKVHDSAFAVDDGRATELVAMRAPAGHVPSLGQRVRVRYTPELHYVHDIEIVATKSKEVRDGVVQASATDIDVRSRGRGPG